MLPSIYDLILYQGDTRSFDVILATSESGEGDDLVPLDLTGHEARAQIRRRPRDEEIVATFAASVVDPTEGRIRCLLTHTESSKLERDGAWDLETTDSDGVVRTWLRGEVTVLREVTR